MIVAIAGIETLDLQSEEIIKWVKEKLSEIIDRIKNKGCSAIITSDLVGVDKEAIRIAKNLGLKVYLVSPTLNTKLGYADLQFFADYTFIPLFADYAVIFTNGQPHSRLDMTKNGVSKCLVVNYLEKSETWISR